MVYEIENGKELDYECVKNEVQINTEMIDLSARADVTMILNVLKELHSDLSLDQFDNIQIYRGGVDLLRIVL